MSVLFTNDARAVCKMSKKFAILHEAAASSFTTDFNELWHASKYSSVYLKLNVRLQWVIKNGNSSAQI